jgi:hypothetical protein
MRRVSEEVRSDSRPGKSDLATPLLLSPRPELSPIAAHHLSSIS